MDRTGYPPGYAGSIKNQLGACPSMLQHVQRLLSDLNPLHRVELYSLKKGEPDLVSSNSLKWLYNSFDVLYQSGHIPFCFIAR